VGKCESPGNAGGIKKGNEKVPGPGERNFICSRKRRAEEEIVFSVQKKIAEKRRGSFSGKTKKSQEKKPGQSQLISKGDMLALR